MGKKKQATASEVKSKVVNFYGTKAEWIRGDLNINMSSIFGNGMNEPAVVAEDESGLYITGKSYVGAAILDPFRLYNRRVPIVNTSEDGTIKYSI